MIWNDVDIDVDVDVDIDLLLYHIKYDISINHV